MKNTQGMPFILSTINRPRVAVALVLVLCVAIIYCFFPGHMDGDALGMLRWIKAGVYGDWYPLLLPFLLRTCVHSGIGPAGVFVLQVVTICLSIYASLAFFWRPVVALVCTCCVVLTPSVLGYLGAITSHGLMTGSALAGFAGLLYLTRPMKKGRRILLFALTFTAISISAIARQNGPVFALPSFSVWLFLLLQNTKIFRFRQYFLTSAVVLGSFILTAISIVSENALLRSMLHPVHNEPTEALVLYDLSAISLRYHHLYIDRKHFPSQKLSDLQKIFRPNFPDYLTFLGSGGVPPLTLYSDPADRSRLVHAWFECILAHPAYYITERYQMFRGLMGLDFRTPEVVTFHPGIDLNELGYHLSNPQADHAVVWYLTEFSETSVDRPFVYFILLVAALWLFCFMLPRAGSVRLIVFSLAAGSFFNVLGYFVASPSTLLRYAWPSIVANMVIAGIVLPYAARLIWRQAKPFGEEQTAVLDLSDWAKYGGIDTTIRNPIGSVRSKLEAVFGRPHRNFKSLAKKVSSQSFLMIDVWGIWFYALCLATFVIFICLDLNGSASGLYRSAYGRGASTQVILGSPHGVQIEEWGVHTPAILNQVERATPFEVVSSAFGNHSVSLLANIPVASISTFFRPQFWAFFLLPLSYAYSIYWQLKGLLLLTGVFTWLLLVTRSTRWAAAGSLWFFFSSCTQWTYSWPSLLPEMTGSICIAMVFACYLTVGRSKRWLAFSALGFAFSAADFAFCGNLPQMIPFMWLALLFLVAWIAAQWRQISYEDKFWRYRLLATLAALLTVATVVGITFVRASSAIQGMVHTIYPGKQIFAGGTLPFQYFLNHYFAWFESEGHFPASTLINNICEASGFLWLAPIALFCNRLIDVPRVKRFVLISLTATLVLLFAWLTLPLPSWFGSLLVLNRTGGSQPVPALGLANVAIVAIAMSSLKPMFEQPGLRKKMFFRRVFAVSLITSAVFVMTNHLFAWFYSWEQLLLTVIITGVAITLVLHGSQRALPLLLVVSSALAFGFVNPVQRGLGVFTSSPMYRFVRTNPNLLRSKWLVYSEAPWGPGFLTATGCSVYDGLRYLPDTDHFRLFAARGLNVNAFNQEGYLLAHPIGPEEKMSIQIVSAAWTRWNVNPMDPLLKELGIRYVAFDSKPPDEIVDHLTPLSAHSVDNYWLYKLP